MEAIVKEDFSVLLNVLLDQLPWQNVFYKDDELTEVEDE